MKVLPILGLLPARCGSREGKGSKDWGFGVAEFSLWKQPVPGQVAGDHTCPGPALPIMLLQAPAGKGYRMDVGTKACAWKGDTVLDPLGQVAAAGACLARAGGLSL